MRVFRLYPDCPAIACDLFVKGEMEGNMVSSSNSGDLKNIENDSAKWQGESQIVVTDKMR